MSLEEKSFENGLKRYSATLTLDTLERRITEELKKARKSVQLPGFRKGKVPLGVLRRMWGRRLEADIREEFIRELTKERFGRPDEPHTLLPAALEREEKDDAGWHFHYVEVPTPIQPLTVAAADVPERPEIILTEEDVDAEVEEIRKNHLSLQPLEALAEDPEHPQRLMTDVVELGDDGQPLEGGVRKNAIFMWEDLPEGLKKELVGRKKGDEVVVDLRAHFEGKEDELAAILEEEVHVINDLSERVALRNIVPYSIILPEVTEEFIRKVFPDLEEPTEANFRERARQNALSYWNRKARQWWEGRVRSHVQRTYSVDLPEEAIRTWYAAAFRSEETADKLLTDQEWQQLRWGVAMRNAAIQHRDSADFEELRKHAATYAYREALSERRSPTDEFLSQRMALYLYHPYYRYLLHSDVWEEHFFERLAKEVPSREIPLKEFLKQWAEERNTAEAAVEADAPAENPSDDETA